MLIAALSAVASFVLTRLEEAPRSVPTLHLMVLASGLLRTRLLLRLRDTQRQTHRIHATTNVEHVVIVEASRLAWFFSKYGGRARPRRMSDCRHIGRAAGAQTPIAQWLSHHRDADGSGKSHRRLCNAWGLYRQCSNRRSAERAFTWRMGGNTPRVPRAQHRTRNSA